MVFYQKAVIMEIVKTVNMEEKNEKNNKYNYDLSVDPNTLVSLPPESKPTNILSLNKPQYLHKDAIKLLDEEFEEFQPIIRNRQKFFGIYNSLFYEMSSKLHQHFYQKSSLYAGGYIDPTYPQIARLNDEIQSTKRQINTIEQHHPFFKNGSILIPSNQWDADPSKFRISSEKYYMHSGKARRIPWDYGMYLPIKRKLGYIPPTGEIADDTYALRVSPATIAALPKGPRLHSIDTLYISSYDVNIYGG